MNPTQGLLARYAPLTPVPGCPQLLAHQASDVFALWQAWEDECGTIRDVPYWAIVWPAARVLSQCLFVNPSLVQGRSVLDCGCGGGVTAIAAIVNGAFRATGCDLDRTAVAIAQMNAAANRVSIDIECRDVVECCVGQRFDLILVADLFYHKEFSVSFLAALRLAQAQGAEILIADSGRPFLPREGLREIHVQAVNTSFDVEGCRARTVRLFSLR